MYAFLLLHCLNNCIVIYILVLAYFLIVIDLYVTDMTFGGPYDADPLARFVLVLQYRHRSHLVETTQVCIFQI